MISIILGVGSIIIGGWFLFKEEHNYAIIWYLIAVMNFMGCVEDRLNKKLEKIENKIECKK